ncbi:MAG: hypothetical protein HN576_05185 [Bacteriovoracaceae bacterium]|jgi:hypothetical protein|nr:hypothetical protein [Bacteriovoracaceae bacterium]
MGQAFSALMQNSMGLKLRPISIRELIYLDICPCDIYGISQGLFTRLLSQKSSLSTEVLRDLIRAGHAQLFVYHQDRQLIIKEIQTSLVQVTRSLSIGDPFEKCKKQMNLLTINMEYLYLDTINDDLLSLQAQSVKNLFLFLINNLEIHEKLFYDYINQKHHYIFAQPMISSLLLCGIMKSAKLFPVREMEALFITSFFKDIGMSAIPTENYDKKDLSDSDKILLSNHAQHSVEILDGRLSFSPSSLNVIAHHHEFSIINKEIHFKSSKSSQKIKSKSGVLFDTDESFEGSYMIGTETVMVCTLDIIAAMITPRPWRAAEKLFDALDLIRIQIGDDFPQEFKSIVSYFKKFKPK